MTRGDLIIDPGFVLSIQWAAVAELAMKYRDRPMDLADGCLVRMTELVDRCRIWTVDRSDFSVYRRNRCQTIPCEFPDEA